jgi:hypothetical protein
MRVHPDDVAAAEEVRDYTLAHGGGTFKADTLSRFEPRSGYAVGAGGGTVIETDWPQVIVHDILAVRANALARGLRYIGTWIDDGKVYVDPVIVTPVRSFAVRTARLYRQRAIYSFETGEAIPAQYPEDDPGAAVTDIPESGR